MKTKWQHGVMLSLFVSGLLLGSGGIVGLADDKSSPYDLKIQYYIEAVDEGTMRQVERPYKLETRRVIPGESLPGNAELGAFLSSKRFNVKAPAASSEILRWTYTGARRPANISLKYINKQNKEVVASRMTGETVTVGGRLNINAPTGYKLTNVDDVNRIVKLENEKWEILVESLSEQTTEVPTPEEAGKPQGQPKPSEKPDSDKNPQLPTDPNLGQSVIPSKPVLPVPPVVPTSPVSKPTFPITHPELVVPVAPDPIDVYPPVTVPKPQVIYTPEGPINSTDLAHVSEMAEHPVTAIDGGSSSTVLKEPTKTSKEHSAPVKGQSVSVHTPRPLTTGSQRQLPQTSEQTTNRGLLGLAALAGLGIISFRRFRH